MPQLLRGKQEDGGRHPDNGRADGGDERQKCHQCAPQNAAIDARNVKGDPAQQSLYDGDHRSTFDRGARDGGKFSEQVLLNKVRQRQRIEDLAHQIRPVFEQEKQQIDHHAKADRKTKRPFANQESATCQVLSAFQRDVRQFLLDLGCVIPVVLDEEIPRPVR
ncbi:hypothetical protein D3C85_1281600 [compost metagenome]